MALEITYNGKIIATLEKGQTATIPCKDKKMLTNLIVNLIADSGEVLEQLSAPTISLDGNILSITATDDNTKEFVILVDGVEMATVSAVNLISFTIDDATYQAEEGMTWEDWCNSEYNTDSFYYDPATVGAVHANNGYNVLLNGASVITTDVITANCAYTISTGSDGSN